MEKGKNISSLGKVKKNKTKKYKIHDFKSVEKYGKYK